MAASEWLGWLSREHSFQHILNDIEVNLTNNG